METETTQLFASQNVNISLALDLFFETSPLMMGVSDVEGDDIRHIIHNQATADFFHFDIEEMQGKLASEAGVPRELINMWLGYYREAQETRKPVRWEYVHNGIDLFVTVAFMEVADTGYPRFSYVVQDMTHQRKNEQELESDKSFRLLANKLPQIIWTSTPEFYVDWYNDWWFEFTGVPRGVEWDDKKFNPMHPDDVTRTRAYIQKVLEKKLTFFEIEQRFKRGSDGEYRWHIVRGVPVYDDQGKIVRWVGANTDIHDHKNLLRELEEEREVRDRFVATLTHDLRTPLTSSKVGAQIIARKVSDNPLLLKTAQRIAENMDRADNMIRDLLDASYLSSGQEISLKCEHLSMNELLRDVLEEQSIVHGDRFRLIEKNTAEGFWDKSAIRRILENLLSNAIKYGEPFAPVTVTVNTDKQLVHLAVHNRGRPLSEMDQKRLFRNFSRTDSAKSSLQPGWGIGLTLVKGLAVSLHGQVKLNSNQKEGTTFTVSIPFDSCPKRSV